LLPFNLDDNTVGGVEDPAAQAQLSCQAIYKGSKANPLHDPANDDACPFQL
jgi:hypothetical protein